MEKNCKECLHNPICQMWRDQEGQDASSFQLSGCIHFEDRSRFVKLPCKIGEKVFCILHGKNEIVEDVVEDYDIWSIKAGIKLRLSLLNHNDYVVAEFGKTVFLTREEAEAALAKMDGGNDNG